MRILRRRSQRRQPIRYPTAQEVAVIREYMIRRYFEGAGPPLTGMPFDSGLLESALSAPAQTFGGTELFPTLADKAACLFRSLIKNHPFLDGNKRTAVITTLLFLIRNRRIVLAEKGELSDLALLVANSTDNEKILRHLQEWFQKRVSPRSR